MKILITGSEGYIGSVLRPILESRGHIVVGIDTGFYRGKTASGSNYKVLAEDIRNISEDNITGFQAVIHLADLSNEPLGMIDEKVTREINFQGAIRFARLAKKAGVRRYVYSSSCSVYGNHTESKARETSPTSPQTMYARCKLDVERELVKLGDTDFTPVILRNSTVYGYSPSMRFDLVVNKMVADAFLFGNIIINNGGDQWRPLMHIEDVSHAFVCAIEAKADAVKNEIFNVGSKSSNYRMRDLGQLVNQELPRSNLTYGHVAMVDKRSYQVDFDKIHKRLPGFVTSHTMRTGVRELHKKYLAMGLTVDQYNHPLHTRMKQILDLLQSQQLDSNYFWKENSIRKPIKSYL